ncbi:MAG TPA: Gfo/Idh/MocA family oxidoreductase, partial [Bryobacteraceae bacterium]
MKTTHRVGIIMNGVTGRMGLNQHLKRSVLAIRDQGGIRLSDAETIMPDVLLLGRNSEKLDAISKANGGLKWSTDLKAALADPQYSVYFDAQTTDRRAEAVKQAIAARKHVYCEKPIATDSKTANELFHLAQKAGVKNGVVQDKLWLPGLMKL